MAAAFTGIDNLEIMAMAILESAEMKVGEKPPTYKIIPAENGADMLDWKRNVEIQDIGHGFWRVGAIGDGNCLLHSFMTAASPTYRFQNMKARQHIVDTFREVLVARMETIRDRMDELYFDVGGSSALEDSLAIINEEREEMGLEVAPAIARIYGFNFLAIGIDDSLKWRPYCQTMRGFNPEAPTVLIHYMGAGANMGNSNFRETGHYEVIVRPVMEERAAAPAGGAGRASARLQSKSAAATTTRFDEVRTSYMLTTADLGYVLDLFEKGCKSDPRYAHPLERNGSPKRAVQKSSSGSRRSVKRSASGRTASGSSGTRKRKSANSGGKRSSEGRRGGGGGGGSS